MIDLCKKGDYNIISWIIERNITKLLQSKEIPEFFTALFNAFQYKNDIIQKIYRSIIGVGNFEDDKAFLVFIIESKKHLESYLSEDLPKPFQFGLENVIKLFIFSFQSIYQIHRKHENRLFRLFSQNLVSVHFFMFTSFLTNVPYNSGFEEHVNRKDIPLISSGDVMLDELLEGGFQKDLIYLLIGDRKPTSKILVATSVAAFADQNFNKRVGFVDGNNRFNPYYISKLAVSRRLSPTKVLENILLARAFTYDQIIELLENKIANLENIEVLLISGITSMLPNHELHNFEELLKAISGIKKVVEKFKPLIVITAPRHECSEIKPVGGNNLYHFGHVLVVIEQTERFIQYKLIQHPFLPEKALRKWLPREPRRGKKHPFEYNTLDKWI